MAAGSGDIMVIEVPVKGYFEENCYFYIDKQTGSGFLIDPGAEAERLLAIIRENDCALKVIYTPGHTTDSVTYYSESDQVAFVGDTIFKDSIGNYKYPGGDRNTLVSSIQNKIFRLPDSTILYSGHSEQTTVKDEKNRYRFWR